MRSKKLLCSSLTLIFIVLAIFNYLPAQAAQRKSGLPRSVATINYPSGDIYAGEQINGIPDGNGTMLWLNGDKYIGEFKNGLMDGQGIYIWADGDRYKGEFKNGRRSGQGVMTWNNGDVYTGQFADGEINGYGTMKYQNGISKEGLWQNAVLLEPSIKPPTGIRTQVLGNQIQVGWDSVEKADHYYVYYSYSYNGAYNCLTDYNGKKTAYGWSSNYSALIPDVPYNTVVYIKVTSVRNGVESEYSNIVSASTPASYYEYYHEYYYEYYPYSYWYPYGYSYPYPYGYYYPSEYPYYYPYDIVTDSNIYGYFTGWGYNKQYLLTNGQIWRQISNTYINTSLYMPRVLIYYINGSYIMWFEGLDEYVYVERIQ